MPAWGGALGARLRAKRSRFGSFILCADRTDSTNALARDLAKAGAPGGSLVLAERQDRGRGRWQRSWASAPGGLYLSVILRPDADVSPSLLPLRAAVAVADGLAVAHGVAPRLRWPNDVFLGGRKLGGVLVEASFTGGVLDFAVVGIGVNVNQRPEDFPEEVRGRATSLRMATGRETVVVETLEDLLPALERSTETSREAEDLARFRELSEGTRGERLRVVSREGDELAAVCEGLSEDGGLRVRLDDGRERTLYSEDVLFVREAGEEPS